MLVAIGMVRGDAIVVVPIGMVRGDPIVAVAIGMVTGDTKGAAGMLGVLSGAGLYSVGKAAPACRIRDDSGCVAGNDWSVVPYPVNGTNGFNGVVGGAYIIGAAIIWIGSSFGSSSAWIRIIMTSCAFLDLCDMMLRMEKRKPKNSIAVTTASTKAK
jgi:hypothetical protein